MTNFDYKFPLEATPCNYGGVRYWLVCQGYGVGKCDRRVGVLYKATKYFACRHCLKIAYKSQSLSGIYKKFGVVNGPEIDRQIWDWRWHQYKGKRTKRYIKLWKKYDKAMALIKAINERRDKRIRKAQERTQKLIPKIREGWKKKMEMEMRKRREL